MVFTSKLRFNNSMKPEDPYQVVGTNNRMAGDRTRLHDSDTGHGASTRSERSLAQNSLLVLSSKVASLAAGTLKNSGNAPTRGTDQVELDTL